jgi:hypothetical protein
VLTMFVGMKPPKNAPPRLPPNAVEVAVCPAALETTAVNPNANVANKTNCLRIAPSFRWPGFATQFVGQPFQADER